MISYTDQYEANHEGHCDNSVKNHGKTNSQLTMSLAHRCPLLADACTIVTANTGDVASILTDSTPSASCRDNHLFDNPEKQRQTQKWNRYYRKIYKYRGNLKNAYSRHPKLLKFIKRERKRYWDYKRYNPQRIVQLELLSGFRWKHRSNLSSIRIKGKQLCNNKYECQINISPSKRNCTNHERLEEKELHRNRSDGETLFVDEFECHNNKSQKGTITDHESEISSLKSTGTKVQKEDCDKSDNDDGTDSQLLFHIKTTSSQTMRETEEGIFNEKDIMARKKFQTGLMQLENKSNDEKNLLTKMKKSCHFQHQLNKNNDSKKQAVRNRKVQPEKSSYPKFEPLTEQLTHILDNLKTFYINNAIHKSGKNITWYEILVLDQHRYQSKNGKALKVFCDSMSKNLKLSTYLPFHEIKTLDWFEDKCCELYDELYSIFPQFQLDDIDAISSISTDSRRDLKGRKPPLRISLSDKVADVLGTSPYQNWMEWLSKGVSDLRCFYTRNAFRKRKDESWYNSVLCSYENSEPQGDTFYDSIRIWCDENKIILANEQTYNNNGQYIGKLKDELVGLYDDLGSLLSKEKTIQCKDLGNISEYHKMFDIIGNF